MHTLYFPKFINLFFSQHDYFNIQKIILQEIITTQMIFKISKSQSVGYLPTAWVRQSPSACCPIPTISLASTGFSTYYFLIKTQT
jgi:hypothetical protein